jgi:hypothetical protein
MAVIEERHSKSGNTSYHVKVRIKGYALNKLKTSEPLRLRP